MLKFFKNLFYIISFFAAIAAIIGVYFQTVTPKPIIDIKTISTDKLTDLPSVDGLKALYTFKNDTVKSLWKLHYFIDNTGDEILIGEGNKKNIIRNSIDFKINSDFKIIDYKINKKNFPFDVTFKDNKINLKFLQWKPEENFDLVLYTEQINKKTTPKLTINEREIINGVVKYSTIYKEITKKETVFEYLPKILQSVLWWFAIISFGLIVVIVPFGWIFEFTKLLKFKKWKKDFYWMYSEWIETLINDKKIESFKEPEHLPYYHWLDYPYIKPTLPNNDFKSLSFGLLIIFVLSAIPILILVKI